MGRSLLGGGADYRIIIAALVLAGVAVLVVLLTQRCYEGAVVCCIVPDGYRGMLLVHQSSSEKEVSRTPDGAFRLDFSDNGQLFVRSTRFLEHIVEISATYVSGAELETNMLPVVAPYDDRVTLSVLSVDSDGTYYFLVGTEEDAIEWYRSDRSARRVD